MGLLDRFRRSATFQPDRCAGDSAALALRSALLSDDLEGVHTPIAGAHSPQRLEFLCAVASSVEGRPAVLDAWVAAEPSSARALLLRGTHGVGWAWQARGAARAQHVSDDAFETFFARLRDAEADLVEAADRDPSDGVVWSQLVVSGRGLQIPVTELRGRLDKARERSPELLRAHLQYLQSACEKWYGSDAEMFEFARSAGDSAPDGSPLRALIASAHNERWLDDDEHLRRAEIQDELREAAERSIWHPTWRDHAENVVALDHFCMAFFLGGASTSAERVARQIAGRFGIEPWRYLRDGPPAGLRDLR